MRRPHVVSPSVVTFFVSGVAPAARAWCPGYGSSHWPTASSRKVPPMAPIAIFPSESGQKIVDKTLPHVRIVRRDGPAAPPDARHEPADDHRDPGLAERTRRRLRDGARAGGEIL